MTREQALYAAASHLLELHPVHRVNHFAPGSKSHRHHVATIDAEDELIRAIAAYEGTAIPPTERHPREGGVPALNNGTR